MGSLITTEQKSALKVSESYVPSLKITYALSDHFKQGKAKLGNFFLEDTDLGPSIKATALAWRYQFVALKDGEFAGSLVVPNTIDLENLWADSRVKDFTDKHGTDVNHGIDILLYLPEQKVFAVLFCAKKLAKAAFPILENGGSGAVVSISTVAKEWKKFSWYELSVTPLAESVAVPPTSENAERTYLAQIAQPAEDDGRER
jgi:hypothetical protein